MPSLFLVKESQDENFASSEYETDPLLLSRPPTKNLGMDENVFTGILASDFFNLDDIENLSIGSDLFSCNIHLECDDAEKIVEIWFQKRLFTGTLTDWFNEITALK